MRHTALRSIVERARDRSGVIALLTLGFMISAGMMLVILLWSIAYITGAYNSLYIANQNAAYAAVTVTSTAATEAHDGQLRFDCETRISDTVCTGGAAFDAAKNTLKTVISNESGSNFGLVYGRTVRLKGPTGDNEAIEIFEIARSPGAARDQARKYGCPIPYGKNAGFTPINGMPNNSELNCWRVTEYDVPFPPKYTNGVITRAEANLQIFPGCKLELCNPTLRVLAAATQAQPTAVNRYDDYYDLLTNMN